MSCPLAVNLRVRRPRVASLHVAFSRNIKIQQATVDNNPAGVRQIKQVI